MPIRVIGAGLAGPEAAWQCARRGLEVTLHEMRPLRRTPAHETDLFGELVCSNSLKSDSENTAPWLLKQEMRRAGSLLMDVAARSSVPAGHALAVDRAQFSRLVTEAIAAEPLIRIERGEVTSLEDFDGITVLATGPLTSDALAAEIQRLGGSERLFFFDSISPIVEADSIDHAKVYRAARYGKGTADYINCPMTREEYEAFLAALVSAQSADAHDWDHVDWNDAPYFEGCLPIEEIARRGPETLRFGPMKPVGLRDPNTGKIPYAVVQLRQENLRADSYNLVGFQNHLKFGEQARILRMIPGLENARFLRYGQIHRNTYINAPAMLTPTLQMKQHPTILFAGQLCGVEGYVESIATGLLAGIAAATLAIDGAPFKPSVRLSGAVDLASEQSGGAPHLPEDGRCGTGPFPVPRASAHGSLVHYICNADAKNFQPANITFDLLEQLDEQTKRKVRDKKLRHKMVCDRALDAWEAWLQQIA